MRDGRLGVAPPGIPLADGPLQGSTAAVTSDGQVIHPRLASDEQMMGRFDSPRGKDVRVEGKLYEWTGMIRVSAIADEEGRTPE